MIEVKLKLPRLHPGQEKVYKLKSRFNVLNCGRRWGKTLFCQELLAAPMEENNGFMNGFPVAYMAPTYKMLMEVWRETLNIFSDLIKFKSETEKRIEFYGGGSVDFWSLDSPDTVRGRKYRRVVIDEAAVIDKLKEAWTHVIRPTLTDLIGDGWFLSTPKGKNNYFYDLSLNEQKYIDWVTWSLPTSTNPYIDSNEIDAAQLELDPLTFAQEYLASFVTENLDSWAYCFERTKHLKKTELNKRYEVFLTFDFNRNPITCGVWQHYDKIKCIEQIKLPNSNVYDLCDHISAKYVGCMFMVTGDATGKASSALVQDNLNYYMVIKSKLRLSEGQFKLPNVNPSLKENRVLVNSVFHNREVEIDPENCKSLVFDLEHARVLPDGNLEKTDRNDPTQQLDALDSMRYYFNTFHRHLVKS